uniref:NADH-ubiquinone oxidoreductase chain 2 n=1 Tax=Paulianina rivalis TaxID=547865 RepID=V9I102_9DIPT|nr:NADH dehydrogenase subunit 2 [Paulianina rivalis]
MFINPSKLLFFFTLNFGMLITISANSWLGAWMGLEINLLSFIPLMMDTNNLMSTEASLKYFLTQALASAVLLFSIIIFMIKTNMTSFFMFKFEWIILIINSCLVMKMGAAPFHFWFPSVMEGLNWMKSLILLTIQKLAPLVILSHSFNYHFIIFIIIFSALMGSLGGLNQISLRKIMAFSSINHLAWMLSALLLSETLWILYFFLYSCLSIILILLFNIFKIFYLTQMFTLFNNHPLIKFSLFSALLSLGGLPPFLGFIPKWLVIQSLIYSNLSFLMIYLIFLSLITLYFYLRIFFSTSLMNYNEMSWNFKIFNKKKYFFIAISNFFSLMGLFFIFFIYLIV